MRTAHHVGAAWPRTSRVSRRSALRQRGERPARNGRRLRPSAPGRRGPRCRGERGGQVDVGDEPFHRQGPPLRKRVVAHDERHADRLLVGLGLGGQTVLAPEVAVVRRKDHDRVPKRSLPTEGVHDAPDHLVDGQERLQLPPSEPLGAEPEVPGPGTNPGRLVGDVPLPVAGRSPGRQVAEGPGVPPRWLGRLVWRIRGEHEEERPPGPAHEPHRLVGQPVGRVDGADCRPRLEPAVHVEPVVVVAGVRERDPAIPPRRHVRAVRVAVQVLPHVGRPVAGGAQPRRDRHAVSKRGEAAVRRPVRKDARRVRVAAGEDGDTAGAAERVGGERISEVDSMADQPVRHVRHRRERVPALVVGQDDDDVGARERGSRKAEEDDERDQSHEGA